MKLRALIREFCSRLPEAVLITLGIWRDIGFVTFMAVTYPVRALLRRRRRGKRLRELEAEFPVAVIETWRLPSGSQPGYHTIAIDDRRKQ